MKLEFYKSLWGFESEDLAGFCQRVKSVDYDGMESPLGVDAKAILGEGLQYVAQAFPLTLDDLNRALDEAAASEAKLLNIQAGRDFWSESQVHSFLEGALKLIESASIPVAFETHRGRIFYSAASTASLLMRFPEIRLTADFSHWTCVSESLLTDQSDSLELAVTHSIYLHARVGHEQGPQVPDPRVPRWSGQLETFEGWWRKIAQAHAKRGEAVLRINPEFGPPNYMPTDPKSDSPASDLWDVCLWMRDRLNLNTLSDYSSR